jgi:pyruvate dehydrogenase E2 component (dihydrolipoamide acetyltransferase)
VIPSTGEKESRGTLGMWFRKQGDAVERGDALCTVETEKASVEIEAPCSGIVRLVVCDRDVEVFVGDCVAIIGAADEDITALAAQVRAARTERPTQGGS